MLSLLVAIGYVISILVRAPGFTLWHDSGSGPGQINVITVGVVLLLALPLIWFPEEIGNATGFWASSSMSMSQVDTPSPAILISIFGWLFLTGPLVVWYFYS